MMTTGTANFQDWFVIGNINLSLSFFFFVLPSHLPFLPICLLVSLQSCPLPWIFGRVHLAGQNLLSAIYSCSVSNLQIKTSHLWFKVTGEKRNWEPLFLWYPFQLTSEPDYYCIWRSKTVLHPYSFVLFKILAHSSIWSFNCFVLNVAYFISSSWLCEIL